MPDENECKITAQTIIKHVKAGTLTESLFQSLVPEFSFKGFFIRDLCIPEIGFSLFTTEYLDALAEILKGKKVLEVCAGHGILGPLMQARGLDWTCTDIEPKAPHVLKMDVTEALLRCKADVIFASWIPLNSTLDYLLAKTGILCIFVTEGWGGCIGSELFWERDGEEYAITRPFLKGDVAQWPGIHDHTIAVQPFKPEVSA